ncbi:MAG: hypothetical protein L6V88_01090 [Anaerotruncus sp.]|nr:MAG: hypothetical protein L6V88_01090 [Anaerotruncus sp.]
MKLLLPNDGSIEDVLYVYINGEQLDLSGGTRDDYGYVVKTDGSVFLHLIRIRSIKAQ